MSQREMFDRLKAWRSSLAVSLAMRLLKPHFNMIALWSPDGDQYVRCLIMATDEFWLKQYWAQIKASEDGDPGEDGDPKDTA